MTKEEYIAFKKNRGPIASLKIEDCIAADALIKEITLANFHNYIAKLNLDAPLAILIESLVCVHFGSVEVNDMLLELSMFPDWI